MIVEHDFSSNSQTVLEQTELEQLFDILDIDESNEGESSINPSSQTNSGNPSTEQTINYMAWSETWHK